MPFQAPATMDEFMSKASDFANRAKAAGKSNTAIANTLTLMYNLTRANVEDRQKKEANTAITPYQQAQIDMERDRLNLAKQGTWQVTDTGQLFNPQTGEMKNSPMADAGTISSQDFGMSPVQAAPRVAPADQMQSQAPPADPFADLEKNHKSVTDQQQKKTPPATTEDWFLGGDFQNKPLGSW